MKTTPDAITIWHRVIILFTKENFILVLYKGYSHQF